MGFWTSRLANVTLHYMTTQRPVLQQSNVTTVASLNPPGDAAADAARALLSVAYFLVALGATHIYVLSGFERMGFGWTIFSIIGLPLVFSLSVAALVIGLVLMDRYPNRSHLRIVILAVIPFILIAIACMLPIFLPGRFSN